MDQSARALEEGETTSPRGVKNLRKRGAIERADTVLALKIEEVEHAARLVHKFHQLDAVGVEHPVDLLTELLSSGALFAADSSLLSKW